MLRPTLSTLTTGLVTSIALALTATAASANETELPTQPEKVAPTPLVDGLNTVMSKLNLTIYGYIKADASYDTANMPTGDYAGYVEQGTENDGQFNVTARQTRLGMKIAGPESDSVKTSGLVEVDFYSGATANSSQPRMRHAYVNVDLPEQDLSVRFGQTSDVISPLVPTTINYLVAWKQGDIGFRRNQFRVTKGFNVGESNRLLMVAAATRSTGSESVGRPGVQARVGYTFNGIGGNKTTVGVSGHTAPTDGLLSSNSINADLVLPLTSSVTLKAEYYSGRNLGKYLGGVATGPSDLETTGFWAALGYKANPTWSFNGGYSMDDPELEDINTGGKTTNATLWTNANYAIDSATTVGLEVAEHTTGYKDADDEKGTRFQLAFTFKF